MRGFLFGFAMGAMIVIVFDSIFGVYYRHLFNASVALICLIICLFIDRKKEKRQNKKNADIKEGLEKMTDELEKMTTFAKEAEQANNESIEMLEEFKKS